MADSSSLPLLRLTSEADTGTLEAGVRALETPDICFQYQSIVTLSHIVSTPVRKIWAEASKVNTRTLLSTEPATAAPLLLGDSDATNQLRAHIVTAARSEAKVLLVGETGVGKEIVARLIHLAGSRKRRPFVAINCAGLPESLLESELFGHVRGSFTGAYRDKPGLAAVADGGTLFLDELGEMSPRMQGMLLRFLETGEIHRVGADRIETRVDVRVIAATNRNLPERIRSGDFREDLYYRINVVHIVIPPLRDRQSDILPLFGHYLEQYCRIQGVETPVLSPRAEALFLAYRWPGNVREIKNIAERVAVRHVEGMVLPEMLPSELWVARDEPASTADASSATEAGPVLHPAAEAAWHEMMVDRQSFWTVVHASFINRELTKSDVRDIVRRGLGQSGGSYRDLVELFHLPPTDYKRFLAFLFQYDCHLPLQPVRDSARAR